MARDALTSAAVPGEGIARRWTDNSEPAFCEMVEDPAVRAVMARDGVTCQDIAALVARFRSAAQRPHAEARVSPSVDPPVAICYNRPASTSSHRTLEPATQPDRSVGLSAAEAAATM